MAKKARVRIAPATRAPIPKTTEHARRVLLLCGCVQRALAPSIDVAATRVLARADIRVEGGTEALNEKLAILRRIFAAFDVVTVEDDTALFREIGEGGVFVGHATDIWRLCVASSAAYAALQASKAQFWYADWAGGLLWLGLPADEETARRLRGVAAQLGGHATLMRGSAEARARSTLTAAVKAAFDPRRLLNPGRMVEEL